jgi:hypothetical protein
MEWMEINCIIDGLSALIEKYRIAMQDTEQSEDDRSHISNDMAYAEILHGKYADLRDKMRS